MKLPLFMWKVIFSLIVGVLMGFVVLGGRCAIDGFNEVSVKEQGILRERRIQEMAEAIILADKMRESNNEAL